MGGRKKEQIEKGDRKVQVTVPGMSPRKHLEM